MAGRRELLARIGRAAAARAASAVQSAVADFGKGTLEQIARRLENAPPPPPVETPPPRPRAERTARPEREAEREEPSQPTEQRTRREAQGLMAELQSLQAATKQIVERLTALGYGPTAEAISRVPEISPPEPEKPGKPPAPAPGVRTKPPKRPGKEAKPLPPLEPKPTEAKYRLQGTLIHVPYTKNLRFLYRMLASEWRRIGIGKKKDGTPQPDGNAYAADAILQAKGGATADAGVRIPVEVLGNEDAFVEWAKEQGYGDGGSIVVDGMIPPPGGAFAGERVWTVDASKYKHLDTDEER